MSAANNEEFIQEEESAPRYASQSKASSDKGIGTLGYTIIFLIFFSEIFFVALLIMSYMTKTKPFVEQVLNFLL